MTGSSGAITCENWELKIEASQADEQEGPDYSAFAFEDPSILLSLSLKKSLGWVRHLHLKSTSSQKKFELIDQVLFGIQSSLFGNIFPAANQVWVDLEGPATEQPWSVPLQEQAGYDPAEAFFFATLPVDPSGVTAGSLRCVGCGFTALKSEYFQGGAGLFELVLDLNLFEKVAQGTFATLGSSLKLLSISRCPYLTDLEPGAFDGLSGLERLVLHNNNIGKLVQRIFWDLTGLKHLQLFGNVVKEVDAEVFPNSTGVMQIRMEPQDSESTFCVDGRPSDFAGTGRIECNCGAGLVNPLNALNTAAMDSCQYLTCDPFKVFVANTPGLSNKLRGLEQLHDAFPPTLDADSASYTRKNIDERMALHEVIRFRCIGGVTGLTGLASAAVTATCSADGTYTFNRPAPYCESDALYSPVLVLDQRPTMIGLPPNTGEIRCKGPADGEYDNCTAPPVSGADVNQFNDANAWRHCIALNFGNPAPITSKYSSANWTAEPGAATDEWFATATVDWRRDFNESLCTALFQRDSDGVHVPIQISSLFGGMVTQDHIFHAFRSRFDTTTVWQETSGKTYKVTLPHNDPGRADASMEEIYIAMTPKASEISTHGAVEASMTPITEAAVSVDAAIPTRIYFDIQLSVNGTKYPDQCYQTDLMVAGGQHVLEQETPANGNSLCVGRSCQKAPLVRFLNPKFGANTAGARDEHDCTSDGVTVNITAKDALSGDARHVTTYMVQVRKSLQNTASEIKTREGGKVDTPTPNVMGGSRPYNFNVIPADLLNQYGLNLDPKTGKIVSGVMNKPGTIELNRFVEDKGGSKLDLPRLRIVVDSKLYFRCKRSPVVVNKGIPLSDFDWLPDISNDSTVTGCSTNANALSIPQDLTFSFEQLPRGVKGTADGKFSGIPTEAHIEPHSFTVTVTETSTGAKAVVENEFNDETEGPFSMVVKSCEEQGKLESLDGDSCIELSLSANISADADSAGLTNGELGGIIAVVVVLLAVILGLVIFQRKIQLRRDRLKTFDFERILNDLRTRGLISLESTVAAGAAGPDESPTPRIPREITRSAILLLGELGSGNFGVVYEAMLDEKRAGIPAFMVAVKALKHKNGSGWGEEDRARTDMLEEAALMAQFEHENVVSLIGVCTKAHNCLVVLQYCSGGALRSYLRSAVDFVRPVYNLLVAAHDTARGCEYLASRNFVHRDIASRNVLIMASGSCKVADFGLSKAIEEGEYFRGHLDRIPVRWTAPEALKGRFSSASDVWAYGVLLFEIFSNGETPYKTLSNIEVKEEVEHGLRLARPEQCPVSLYDNVMKPCWVNSPPDRPSFPYIVQYFDHALALLDAAGSPALHSDFDAKDHECGSNQVTDAGLHVSVDDMGGKMVRSVFAQSRSASNKEMSSLLDGHAIHGEGMGAHLRSDAGLRWLPRKQGSTSIPFGAVPKQYSAEDLHTGTARRHAHDNSSIRSYEYVSANDIWRNNNHQAATTERRDSVDSRGYQIPTAEVEIEYMEPDGKFARSCMEGSSCDGSSSCIGTSSDNDLLSAQPIALEAMSPEMVPDSMVTSRDSEHSNAASGVGLSNRGSAIRTVTSKSLPGYRMLRADALDLMHVAKLPNRVQSSRHSSLDNPSRISSSVMSFDTLLTRDFSQGSDA